MAIAPLHINAIPIRLALVRTLVHPDAILLLPLLFLDEPLLFLYPVEHTHTLSALRNLGCMKQDLQTSVTKKRYVEVLPYGVLEARTALLSLERGDLLGFAFYKPWITGGAIDGESPSHIVAQDMAERRTATQSQGS